MLRKLAPVLTTLPLTRPIVSDHRRRRFMSRLEWLEVRVVPSTFTVTTTLDAVANDGRTSLREAITAANAHRGADTIIVPAGVYGLTLSGNDDSNAAGDFDVTDSTVFRAPGRERRSLTASSSTGCSTCWEMPRIRSMSRSRI